MTRVGIVVLMPAAALASGVATVGVSPWWASAAVPLALLGRRAELRRAPGYEFLVPSMAPCPVPETPPRPEGPPTKPVRGLRGAESWADDWRAVDPDRFTV